MQRADRLTMVLILAAVGFLPGALVRAQAPSASPRVVVGVPNPDTARGLSSLDAEKNPRGFTVAILRAAFGRVGQEVEFKSIHTHKLVVNAFSDSEIDLICPFQVNERYMLLVDYSAPIVVCRGAVFGHGQMPQPDRSALLTARVIVARGGSAHEWCLRNDIPCETSETLRGAFQALSAGEYDYLVTTQMAGRVDIAQLGLRNVVEFPLPEPGFDEVFAAAVRPGDGPIVADLNRGLALLRESGEYDRIYDEWLAALQPHETPVRLTSAAARNILLAIVGVLLLVTGAVALLARSLARRRRDLERSEARYRLIAESSPALVYQYWVGRDGKRSLVYANQNLSDWMRVFPSLDLNKPYEQTIIDDIHVDDRATYGERTRASRETGARFDVEFRLRDAAGLFRWVHAIATPTPRPDGVVWNGLLLDLTEQRRTADELVRSEQRYREIFECSHDAIVVFDPETDRIVAANERAAALYGYERTELVGINVRNLAIDQEVFQRRTRELLRKGGHASERIRQRRRDGSVVEADVSTSLIELDSRTLVLSLNRDVSDRVHAEQRLREAQALLEAAIDGADLGTWVIEFDTEEISVDARMLRFFGFDLPPGRYSRFQFVDRIVPEDRDAVNETFIAARDRHERYQTRFRVARPTGPGGVTEIRWLSTRGAVQLDAAGRAVRLVGATMDITDAQLAEEERKRFEETRAHAARLESLGVLAGGIAHDFNNLLVGILGNASMAQSLVAPDHPTTPILSQLVNAGNRAAELTRQLLAYAGKAKLRTEPLDLSNVVSEMPGLLGPRLGPGATLIIEPSDGAVAVVGDMTQIRQAVMNLIVNAADAFGELEGRITVRACLRDLSEAYLRDTPPPTALPPGCYACVEVADSAGALDPRVIERIFDPFFSTKFTGRGLGLSVVMATAKRHSGAVKIELCAGRETRFVLIFPPTTLPAASGRPVATRAAVPPGRVLLVDDESIVRHTVAEVLRLSGWDVVAVESGEAAVRFFDRDSAFDAAVIDVTMPGMTGFDLCRRLRAAAPRLPIVLTSGFAEESLLGGSTDPLTGFVAKPFEVSTLLGTIDSLRLRRASGAVEASPSTSTSRGQAAAGDGIRRS